MNGKRIIVDCKTGKETLVEPSAEFLAQREIDRVASDALDAERAEKDAHEKLIQAEIRKIAENSLVAKGELEKVN